MRGRSRAFYVIAVIVLLVGVLEWFGAFSLPGGRLYDYSVELVPASIPDRNKVLMIEAEYSNYRKGDEVWLKLAEKVEKMGAKQIVFLFVPDSASRDFYKFAGERDNIYLGLPIVENRLTGGSGLPVMPLAAHGMDFKTGSVEVPDSKLGVSRTYYAFSVINGRPVPSVLLESAQDLVDKPLVLDREFWVNFNGFEAGVPIISLGAAESGSLDSTLVKDRTVIIGFSSPPGFHGLFTPLSSSPKETMSFLEYSGVAFLTMVNQNPITFLEFWAQMLIVLAVTVLCVIVYQILSATMAILYTFFFFCLILALSWFGLAYLYVWFPVFEVVLALLLSYQSVFFLRWKRKDALGRQSLTEATNRLRSKVQAESFLETDEYWKQIIVMVNQVLNLDRAIFLESLENDHRVEEIIALHCSIDDIKERRRDYHRTPYTTASKAGRPIRVQNYLVMREEDEVQFMVPLQYRGEVLGFWAFSTAGDKLAELEAKLPAVRIFAEEIAVLLNSRKQWLKDKKDKANVLLRLMHFEAGDEVYTEVGSSLQQLLVQIDNYENALDGLGTGVALYDLFGNLVHINPVLRDLITGAGANPYTITALDMTAVLTGKAVEEVRDSMYRVIIEREAVYFQLTKTDKIQGNQLLVIKPLIKGNEGGVDTASPFELSGVLLEITDLSYATEMFRFKEQLFEHMSHFMAEHLGMLSRNCNEFSRMKDIPTAIRNEMGKSCSELSKLIAFTDKYSSFMNYDLTKEKVGIYPVTPETCLKQAISRAEVSTGIEVNHTCESVKCSLHGLVYANPHLMTELFEAMLNILSADSKDDYAIRAEIYEKDEYIIFRLKNTGYGLPEEALHLFIFEKTEGASKDHQAINNFLPVIESWNASLEASSEIGKGTVFALILTRMTKENLLSLDLPDQVGEA